MATKVLFIVILICTAWYGILSESTSDPCAEVMCASGRVCKLQHRICKKNPCLPSTVCVPGQRVKDGHCPSRKRRAFLRRCGRPCSNDFNCPGTQKCCVSGVCGKMCTSPVN